MSNATNELRQLQEELSFELLLLDEADQKRVLNTALQAAKKLTAVTAELRGQSNN